MNVRKGKRPIASMRKLMSDLIAGISLNECARRSLSNQEIGAPEQVALEQARNLLWRVHDALDELCPSDDDEDS